MKRVIRFETHDHAIHETESAARNYLESLIQGAVVSIYDELSVTPGRAASLEVLMKHSRMTMPRVARYQDDLKVQDDTYA